VLNVDGYKDGPCCEHYTLDLATGQLTEGVRDIKVEEACELF
jgi:hypothetical protein